MVYNSTNALEQSFKEKTGALATIESKIQSHLNESFPLSTSEVNSIYDEFVEILDEVRAIEGVDNLDFRTWAWLNEFETFTLFSRVECSFTLISLQCHDIRYSGVSSVQFNEMVNNLVEISQGRNFTQQEIDEGHAVALISDNYKIRNAQGDEILVGDIIPYTSIVYDQSKLSLDNEFVAPVLSQIDYNVQIIGKFRSLDIIDGNRLVPGNFNPQEHVYFPSVFIQTIRKDLETMYVEAFDDTSKTDRAGITAIDNVRIYIKTPDEMDRVTNEIKTIVDDKGSSNAGYKVINSDQDFQKILSPIMALRKLGSTTFYVSLILSTVLLSLVVVFFLRERKTEMGIYMALGENRIKIVAQIMIEVLAITMLAMSLAIFSGKYLASQVTVSISDTGMTEHGLVDNISNNDIADKFVISITSTEIMTIYSIALVTVLLSSVFPTVYIIRMNPKKVLL